MDNSDLFSRYAVNETDLALAGRFLHADERVWREACHVPPHLHPDYEVIIPLAGEYRCLVAARYVAARPGQIVLVRPGTWHEDHCPGRVSFRTFVFSSVLPAGSLFARDAAVPLVWTDRTGWWDALWLRARSLAADHRPWGRSLADALATEALAWLCEQAPAGSLDAGLARGLRRGALARRLEEAFLAIGGRPSGLAGLARHVGLPPRTLRARCVRELGESPSRLWLAWRLRRAHDLLVHTQATCAAIAEGLGFASAAHFSRAFRSRFGNSPAGLRAAAIGKPTAAAVKALAPLSSMVGGMDHPTDNYTLALRSAEVQQPDRDHELRLGDHLNLTLGLRDGLVTESRLEANGVVWADGPWLARFGVRDQAGRYAVSSRIRQVGDTGAPAPGAPTRRTLEFAPDWTGAFRPDVRLRLTCDWEDHRLDVAITLLSRHDAPLALEQASLCWQRAGIDGIACFPVPFGETGGRSRPLPLSEQPTNFALARDGAVLLLGTESLLLARRPRNVDQRIEVYRDGDGLGFGILGRTLAEELAEGWLAPGEERDLGAACLMAGRTGLASALRTHRAWMRQHGIGIPAGYQPPLSYCMFYEAECTWGATELCQGLETAADLGCELLYTDQGWETSFGSGLWDEARLGPCASFVAAARARGLGVGVLVALHSVETAVWGLGPAKKDRRGATRCGDAWHEVGICPANPAWQTEKTQRLVRLVDDGVGFFSFDFHNYTGSGFNPLLPDAECCDPSHGHAVPLPRWGHAQGVAAQQAAVRRARGQVLIESHDWMLAGACELPCYLHPGSCQELWGFEYMWHPLQDLLSGRIHNLYWYNLAYERPLYLHIDLRSESPHLVVFWYMASVIRHLGIGAVAGLPAERKAVIRAAIAVWKQHRDWFVHGAFDGPDPCVHVHTLPDRGAVVMVFNDQDTPTQRRLELSPVSLGVSGTARVTAIIGDAPLTWDVTRGLQAEITLPPLGVAGWRVEAHPAKT